MTRLKLTALQEPEAKSRITSTLNDTLRKKFPDLDLRERDSFEREFWSQFRRIAGLTIPVKDIHLVDR